MPALWGTGKRLSLPSVVTGGECVDCIKYTNTVAQTGPEKLGIRIFFGREEEKRSRLIIYM
jgi:hypothetical protein